MSRGFVHVFLTLSGSSANPPWPTLIGKMWESEVRGRGVLFGIEAEDDGKVRTQDAGHRMLQACERR